jgi:hypothetical protein
MSDIGDQHAAMTTEVRGENVSNQWKVEKQKVETEVRKTIRNSQSEIRNSGFSLRLTLHSLRANRYAATRLSSHHLVST